jgi:AAA family ATP:ADP antiporter
MIAVGGTLGAMFGPWLAWTYVEAIGTANLILIAVGFLGLAILWTVVLGRLRPSTPAAPAAAEVAEVAPGRSAPSEADRVIGGSPWEGFKAVVRSPYLLGICLFVLIMAIMATFIYFTRLAMVAEMTTDMDQRTGFFAQIDFWTQSATFALQLLLTGHIMRRLGVGVAMVLLPLTVVLGFVGLAITGTFAALILLEAAYRAMQRGITRPARETLFTVVSREDKYKAKAVTDTFVYRAGDVVGAWSEGLLGRLGAGLVGLTAVVIPMAVGWAVLSLWLARKQLAIASVPATEDEKVGAPL